MPRDAPLPQPRPRSWPLRPTRSGSADAESADSAPANRHGPADRHNFPTGVTAYGLESGSHTPAVIATAIHDGHDLPEDITRQFKLIAVDRRREEDPFTADLIADIPDRIVVQRSRFAGDLNRPRSSALYRGPDEAWGLDLWHRSPDDALVADVQAWHGDFYRAMGRLLDQVAAERSAFVLLDVHSYNHRRAGPDAPATPAHRAPDINIGTASLPPGRADALISAVHDRVRATTLPDGRTPTIANDVAFQGRGELTRFVNTRHAGQGCALAIEVRKFFMDEWSGAPDTATIAVLRSMFSQLAADLARLLPR